MHHIKLCIFGLNSIVFPKGLQVFSNSMKNKWQKQAEEKHMKFKFKYKQKKKDIFQRFYRGLIIKIL